MMLVSLLITLAATDPLLPRCADPEVLEQRLDEILMKLDAGLSFDAVREVAGEPITVLEGYVPIEGEASPPADTKLRAGFLPAARDGSRSAFRYVDCFFDQNRVLLSCRPFRGRQQSQSVSSEQADRLKTGMTRANVRKLLCSPGSEQIDEQNGDVIWNYSYSRPGGFMVLRFDRKGKLRKPDIYFHH